MADALGRYRQLRDFRETPEPEGAIPESADRKSVV